MLLFQRHTKIILFSHFTYLTIIYLMIPIILTQSFSDSYSLTTQNRWSRFVPYPLTLFTLITAGTICNARISVCWEFYGSEFDYAYYWRPIYTMKYCFNTTQTCWIIIFYGIDFIIRFQGKKSVLHKWEIFYLQRNMLKNAHITVRRYNVKWWWINWTNVVIFCDEGIIFYWILEDCFVKNLRSRRQFVLL